MRCGAGRAFLAASALVVAASVAPSPAASAPSATKKHRKAKPAAAPKFDAKLPVLGTRLSEFPLGVAKSVADQACLNCHSADMIWQQHLSEKQWTAEVTKMINWGAEVPEGRKDELLAYLLQNFGPDNARFQPVVTRPVGR